MTNTAIADTTTHLHDSAPYLVGHRLILPQQIQSQTQSCFSTDAGKAGKLVYSIIKQSRLKFLFAVHSIFLSIS